MHTPANITALRTAAIIEGAKLRNRLGIITLAGKLAAVDATLRRAERLLDDGTRFGTTPAPGARGEHIVTLRVGSGILFDGRTREQVIDEARRGVITDGTRLLLLALVDSQDA